MTVVGGMYRHDEREMIYLMRICQEISARDESKLHRRY